MKKEILLLTYNGSHNSILSRNYDIHSSKYFFTKYLVHYLRTDYTERDLSNFLLDVYVKDKEAGHSLSIVMTDCPVMRNEYIDLLRNYQKITKTKIEKDINFPNIEETSLSNCLTENFEKWCRYFKYIQQILDKDIAFLFTIPIKKERFKTYIDIANGVGLRNFRFISEPFFVRELDEQIDNLILRFYTNRAFYNKRMQRRARRMKKTNNENGSEKDSVDSFIDCLNYFEDKIFKTTGVVIPASG